jgi:hypothetical protein
MPKIKNLRWKPVISFFCILGLLFFGASLYSPKVGSILVGSIITALTLLSSLLPDHYTWLNKYWFEKINSGTHSFFIWLTSIGSVVIGVLLIKNYHIVIDFKKNK